MAEKIRLLVHTSYLGSGGAEKHLVRLVNALDPLRFEVVIVTPNKTGQYESELRKGIRLLKVGFAFKWSGTVMRLSGVWGLRRIIKREKPDLIYSLLDIHNLILLKALPQGFEGKVVLGVQNSIEDSYGKSTKKIKQEIYKRIPQEYPKADAVLCLSEGVAHDLSNLVPEVKSKITIINNIGYTPELEDQVAMKSGVELPEGDKILAIGRLVYQKGYDYLIKAFAKVRAEREASLIILGEGELKNTMIELSKSLGIERDVHFMGFQTNPFAIGKECSMFALSSNYEGFGNVVVEALTMQLPVVSTDCPHGPSEILENGKYGLLVPVQDDQALAEGMLKLLDDQAMVRNLKSLALSRAKEFSAEKIAAKHATFFEEMVSDR